ncbi:hypothetical protein Tco_0496945 [Tanacetum coccineum]
MTRHWGGVKLYIAREDGQKKLAENVAADPPSKTSKPPKIELEKQNITTSFPLESLGKVEEVKEINVNDNVLNENENVVENNVLNNVNVLSDNTTPCRLDLAKLAMRLRLQIGALKGILERTIGENRASWSDNLDDSTNGFRTALQTPMDVLHIGGLMEKLPQTLVEVGTKSFLWALSTLNLDLTI